MSGSGGKGRVREDLGGVEERVLRNQKSQWKWNYKSVGQGLAYVG